MPVVEHGCQRSRSSPLPLRDLARASEKANSFPAPPTFTATLDLPVLILAPEAELLLEMPKSSSLATGKSVDEKAEHFRNIILG